METKAITIRVSAEVARIFEAASEEQRHKLEALLSIKLSDVTRSKRSLEEIMSEVSHNARDRGLTPEILDSLLNES
jgi:vacuolar-type H+-ATPase subunit E/Vma4